MTKKPPTTTITPSTDRDKATAIEVMNNDIAGSGVLLREDRESREVQAMCGLVLWARENGVALSEIQVGMSRMNLVDTRLVAQHSSGAARRVAEMSDAEARQNLYEQMGGEALKAMTAEQQADDPDLAIGQEFEDEGK